jgi:thioredoxin-related protein
MLPLQKPVAVTVNELDCFRICNGDVIWLDANHSSQSFMSIIDCFVTTTSPTLVHQPQVGEGSWERCGYVPETPFSKIWKKIVEERESKEEVGCI